jgi:hypothetical protein
MTDTRPADCRFRLKDEGKPYPRSSCPACGRTVTTGLGNKCGVYQPTTAEGEGPPPMPKKGYSLASSGLAELMFVNVDAKPKVSVLHVSLASVPAIMAWYGAYYAGDRYTVKVNSKVVEKDQNGEFVGTLPLHEGSGE